MCLLKAGHLDEAIPVLQQAVALAPDEPRFLHRLGAALHEAGREEEALECAERLRALEEGS